MENEETTTTKRRRPRKIVFEAPPEKPKHGTSWLDRVYCVPDFVIWGILVALVLVCLLAIVLAMTH